jgi:transposase
VTVREQIWVGIDVGKAAHHACAVDESGKVIFSQRLRNDQAAIEALIARATAVAETVRWAVDMTSGTAALLLALLHAGGCTVQYVPGKLVNRMSGAFAGEGKTDAKDARTIAETTRLRSDLSTITPPEALIVQLQVLTSHHDDLRADWVRGVNRLRALLAGFFPAPEAALDYSTRAPLILLTGFQTPAALRAAGPDSVHKFLLEHGAVPKTAPTIAAKALAAAADQAMTLPTEAISAPLVARLAGELLNLGRQIRELDKQIIERFNGHRHGPRISSVPGFGPILGAQLLADTSGDPLRVFATPAWLAAYAGLAPLPRDSGRVRGNLRRPKRYHRRLRGVFHMAAFVASNLDGPSRDFYRRKRAEGKRHTQALIALARRLVDVIWALLRDEREFTPARPAPSAGIAA